MKSKDRTTKTQAELDEGDTAAERFKGFAKQIVSVPKEEIDKREAEYQNQRATKKTKKKTAKAS
jgi:hypothetical protein